MSEAEAILSTPSPRTRACLVSDLRQLGMAPGMTVMLHSSLSSLGWVCGGPVTVVQALMDVVTAAGTLVMPTHSADYSGATIRDFQEFANSIRHLSQSFQLSFFYNRNLISLPKSPRAKDTEN